MENYSLDNLHFDLMVADITEIAKAKDIFAARHHLNKIIEINSPPMPKKPELPSLRVLTNRNFKTGSNGENTIQKLQAHLDEIEKYKSDLEIYKKEYNTYEKEITKINRFASDIIFDVILRVTNFYEIVPQDEQTVIIDLLKSIRDARFGMSNDTLHEIVRNIVSDYKWRD